MSAPQSRIIEATPASIFVTMLAYIMPLGRLASKVDALVVFPGLGETSREITAIKDWGKRKIAGKFLLIAGQNPGEKNTIFRSIENLRKKPFNLPFVENVHSQGDALNTPGQALWVAEKVKELGIKSLALSVSPYHMLRAYLTLLKTFTKRQTNILIAPFPTPLSPTNIVPEVGKKQIEMVPAELDRITKYQGQGDVATMEELVEYLNWAYDQPLVQTNLA